MKPNRNKKIAAAIVVSVLSLMVIVSLGSLLVNGDPDILPYTITVDGDIITVDCGRQISTFEPMEFYLPLHYLDLAANEIKKIETTCQCTVPTIRPEDQALLITYSPKSSSLKISQLVSVIPVNEAAATKFVRLTGEIVPAWIIQREALVVADVRPGEKRRFSTHAEINYDLDKIVINSVQANPELDDLMLDYHIIDNQKLVIEGVITGRPQREKYRGDIEIFFGSGQFEKLKIPMTMNHIGMISTLPGSILFSDKQQEMTVEFNHCDSVPLSIEHIICPDHLRAAAIESDDGRCLLQVMLKTPNLVNNKEVTASKIQVDFVGIDQPGLVRVMILPVARNDI